MTVKKLIKRIQEAKDRQMVLIENGLKSDNPQVKQMGLIALGKSEALGEVLNALNKNLDMIDLL